MGGKSPGLPLDTAASQCRLTPVSLGDQSAILAQRRGGSRADADRWWWNVVAVEHVRVGGEGDAQGRCGTEAWFGRAQSELTVQA